MKNKSHFQRVFVSLIRLTGKHSLATHIAVALALLGVMAVPPQLFHVQASELVSAAAKNIPESGKWGEAPYELDNGKLVLSGGNVGSSSASLSSQLKISGIDPSEVTSIDITGKITGQNIPRAFADFSNLKSITGLGNLAYYGDASSMFSYDKSLNNLDLKNFDTGNITNMSGMFYGMSALTSLDVSAFDTSKVTTMQNMFSGDPKLTGLDVSHFDTANVTNMAGMFYGMSSLTSLDVSTFDTSKATTMQNMFSGDSKLTGLDVSHFNTANVIDMGGMFYGMSSLTSLDVSAFDTSKVTDMGYMFASDSALGTLDISGFDTSSVTYMVSMFYGMSSLTSLDVSAFDTSKVTNMGYMFASDSALETLDLSGFDTSSVTNMASMFQGMSSLINLDISAFDTKNVTDMHYMFYNDLNIVKLDLTNFIISSDTNTTSMFGQVTALKELMLGSSVHLSSDMGLPEIPLNNTYTGYWIKQGAQDKNHWTSSELLNNYNPAVMGGATFVWEKVVPDTQGKWGGINYTIDSKGALTLFSGSDDNVNTSSPLSKTLEDAGISPSIVKSITIANRITAKDIVSAFAYFPNLESISGLGNLTYYGNAFGMFSYDLSLASIDFTGFDSSHINNFSRLFFGDRALTSFDASVFNDTSNVTDMSYMFADTSIQALDLSNIDSHNVSNMSGMFANTSALKSLNIKNLQTQNVTDMSRMFLNASSLESLDFTSFTITTQTNTEAMLSGDKTLKELTFGRNVQLHPDMLLPDITVTEVYTGKWKNLGTSVNPAGSDVWSSSELLTNYDPTTMSGDTFVWQTR